MLVSHAKGFEFSFPWSFINVVTKPSLSALMVPSIVPVFVSVAMVPSVPEPLSLI